MPCSSTLNNQLERKEARSVPSSSRRVSGLHPFTPTTMPSASRILPINTSDGIVDIPGSAFAPLGDELRERFNVHLRVHKHKAGVNHGEFVPLDHYLVELTAASHEQIEEAIDAIDDRVNALVERFTTQRSTEVPAGR